MKYRRKGEDYREAVNREAMGLKDDDEHWSQYREIRLDMRFMPGGRIQSDIGSLKQTTAFNCFVSGIIPDSFVARDNPQQSSIMHRAEQAAATMRMGGGIGYDFSTLRPRGALIKKLLSQSSGLRAFMDIYDAVCRATASSGHRRGAQMGVLRVDHPDIEEFILAKQNTDQLTGFNISIALTDEFMEAVQAGKEFDLRFNGEVYKTVDAAELWERVMRSTWDWGEPGCLFIDRINEMNNLAYCEIIAATNPCGEQPLPPFGACLLGSIVLPKYLKTSPHDRGPAFYMDYDTLRHDILPIVRAMDNVTDRTKYPLAEQKAEAISKRRMGIGVLGLANAGEACGLPYGTLGFLEFERKILELIRDETYRASVEIAKKKGAFPLFDERYLDGKFIKTLPDDIQRGIRQYGIRNSHLTSIAPTGTISMCSDNMSGGIEPVFSLVTKRPINTPEGPIIQEVEDYGAAFLNTKGKIADNVTANEHIAVLCTAQQFVDSGVSKTVNMDGKIMSWDDFKNIYFTAFKLGAKGCATFNKSGKRMALLSSSSESDQVCYVDKETGRKECA